MKNKLFKWLFVLLAAVMCVGVTSCSDGDEENVTTGTTIVGKWKYAYSSRGYALVTFNADGSGMWLEYDGGELDMDYPFTWSLDGDELTIITASELVEGEYDTRIYKGVVVTGKTMTMPFEGEDNCIWHRQ